MTLKYNNPPPPPDKMAAISQMTFSNAFSYGRHFTDDIFKCIFLNEKFRILIPISLKFVPEGPISNIPALV